MSFFSIEDIIRLKIKQIQKITPIRQKILKILHKNYNKRPTKPYTTVKELAKKLSITSPSIIRHIKELKEIKLIKKIKFSTIDKKYRYKYDNRTKYVYHINKYFHELQKRGSFKLSYLDNEHSSDISI